MNAIKRTLFAISMIGLTATLLATCSRGGGGGAPPPATRNELLSGDYQIHIMEYNNDNSVTNNVNAEIRSGTADGHGNFTGGATATYRVEADRTMTLTVPNMPIYYGITSNTGDITILMEAQYDDPAGDDDLQLLMVVRKSAGLTLADMSGTYIVGEEGRNASGQYTTRAELALASNGTGTLTTLSHSQGLNPVPYTVTVSFNPAEGTYTMTSSSWTDSKRGIVAPNTEVFVMSDGLPDDTDTYHSLSVGVRKSGGTAPIMSGTYQTFFIGMDTGSKLARRFNAAFNPSTMMFDCTVLALFDPLDPTGTGRAGMTLSVPVTAVAGDGTFVVDTEPGILSPDGTFLMVLDATTGDGETKIVVGQK